jgi:hypothetical protein
LYSPSNNFKTLSTQSLGQLVSRNPDPRVNCSLEIIDAHCAHQVSSLGDEYAAYASRIVADKVAGNTIEFIFEQNDENGESSGQLRALLPT